MEERIIDDEYGRGVRLKKTKDGFVDVTDELADGENAEVEEGDAYGDADCGFSVFITGKGEELWQVSKRLACAPEDLQKSNPDLQFPLKEGERIYVYRQLKD